MREDALDEGGILDARDHHELPAAATAALDVDRRHPFQPLHPSHRGVFRDPPLGIGLPRAAPAAGKGFGVAAVSRAGVAEAKWAPLASQALKFEGLSFVCVIPVPGKEPMHMEQRITGESCGDPGSWTIRPTNIVRGPGVNKVDPDPPFQTSCVPAGSPEAESQLRARRARLAPAAGCAPTRPKPMAR